MKHFKLLAASLLIIAFGTRAVFADAVEPTIIDSDSGVLPILIIAVVVIIIAVILLRRSMKKHRESTEKGRDD